MEAPCFCGYGSNTKGHSGGLGMTFPCLQYSHKLRAGSLGKLSQPVIGTYHRRERHSRAGSGERNLPRDSLAFLQQGT